MAHSPEMATWKHSRLTLALALSLAACAKSEGVEQGHGDLAKSGGSATVRRAYEQQPDDPSTSNDETNDQPLGHFGTVTVEITSDESGNTYTLDAELDGQTVERVYFPKGGWVDFYDCEVDEDLIGECEDEEGRYWSFEGESSFGASSHVDEEESDDDEWGADEQLNDDEVEENDDANEEETDDAEWDGNHGMNADTRQMTQKARGGLPLLASRVGGMSGWPAGAARPQHL